MFYRTVNIEKTLSTRKICFNKSRWDEIINVLIDIQSNIICFGILILAVDYILHHKSDWISDPLGSFLSIALSVCLCILALNRSLTRRKLSKLTTCGKEEILMALKQLNWEIPHQDLDYIVAKPNRWRQITILFDNKDVYIHSIREGLHGIYTRSSFIHSELLEILENIEIVERNKNAV